MTRLGIFAALFLLMATPLRAERPAPGAATTESIISPGDVKVTPQMWFYEQAMRNYKDPKMAVRAAADLRADQRQRRIESMKWFGFSNSRPRASSDPFHGDYSPGWVSVPGYFPSRWNGVSQP
jgi:hypothetical protein